MKHIKTFEQNSQDMMSIPTSVGKDHLKFKVHEFLFKNSSLWETKYGDGSYFIAVGNEDDELGFQINKADESRPERGSKDGWKSSAYPRNGYVLGSQHMGPRKELYEYIGLGHPDDVDIDTASEIADYIVDWFLEVKEDYNMSKN